MVASIAWGRALKGTRYLLRGISISPYNKEETHWFRLQRLRVSYAPESIPPGTAQHVWHRNRFVLLGGEQALPIDGEQAGYLRRLSDEDQQRLDRADALIARRTRAVRQAMDQRGELLQAIWDRSVPLTVEELTERADQYFTEEIRREHAQPNC